MTSASASLPSLLRAAFVSLCLLRGCWKVRIGIIALACAFGVFCVALGANAGSSQGRCCAELVCCILCVYWNNVPRACSALSDFLDADIPGMSINPERSETRSVDLSVSPQTKAEPVVGFANGRKKWGFSVAFQEETQYLIAPSYAEHLVFTGLGEIKQPCTRPLSEQDLVREFFGFCIFAREDARSTHRRNYAPRFLHGENKVATHTVIPLPP